MLSDPCCSSLPYHIQRYSHYPPTTGPFEVLATQLRQKIRGNLKFLTPCKALSTSRQWDFASPAFLSQCSVSAVPSTQTPHATPLHQGALVGKCADIGIDHLQGRGSIVLCDRVYRDRYMPACSRIPPSRVQDTHLLIKPAKE